MQLHRRILSLLGKTLLIAALLAGPLAQPGAASDVDKLLDLLVRKNVITQQEAAALREEMAREKIQPLPAAASQAPPAPLAKAAAPPKDRPVTTNISMRLSGFAQTRFTSTAGAKNSLEIRRARLALGGNLAEKISYRMQVDFVRSPVLLDARVDFTHLPYARLSVGQFKVPFGQENLTASQNLLTVERSALTNALVPGRDTGNNGRDIGLQFEGTFHSSHGRPVLTYSLGMFNGAGINRKDDNHRKDAAVRLVTHVTEGFWIGGDYFNGAIGVAQADKERAAFEFAFVRSKYSLRGEYVWGRDATVHKRGSYTQFAYRFRPHWEGLFRFEEVNPSKLAARDEVHNYLMGFNWYFHENVKLQTNYIFGDEAARRAANHTFLTQLQFQF